MKGYVLARMPKAADNLRILASCLALSILYFRTPRLPMRFRCLLLGPALLLPALSVAQPNFVNARDARTAVAGLPDGPLLVQQLK